MRGELPAERDYLHQVGEVHEPGDFPDGGAVGDVVTEVTYPQELAPVEHDALDLPPAQARPTQRGMAR
jgi:hypothetical protein